MSKYALVFMLFLVAVSGCLGKAKAQATEDIVTSDAILFINENIAHGFREGGRNTTEFGIIHRGDKLTPIKNIRLELFNPFDLKVENLNCINADSVTDENGREGCNKDDLVYGETMNAIYRLKAPDKLGVDLEGSIGYSVTFDYSLKSKVSMPVVDPDEETRGGNTNPPSHKITYQQAPIKPVFEIGDTGALEGVPFNIRIHFESVGGSGDVNKVVDDIIQASYFEMIVPPEFEVDRKRCDFIHNTDRRYTVNANIAFSKGKSNPFTCWFTFTGTLNQPYQVYDINFNIEKFGYEYRKYADVTINK